MFSRKYLFQCLASLVILSVAGLARCEDTSESTDATPASPAVAVTEASHQMNGALERILSNEPLKSGEALELLKELASSSGGADHGQLNVQSLIELSQVSAEKCHPIADVFEAYLDMNKSLGPYLNEHYWKQVDLCKKVFGKQLLEAVGQLDGQVRADIEVLGQKIPQDQDPYRGVAQNNLIQAIVHFVLNETKKPEGERRYFHATLFSDMKDILVEDCKKMEQVLGDIIDPKHKVPQHLLSLDELRWWNNAKACAQMTKRNPATIRLASIVFKSNYNHNHSEQ